MSEPVIAPLSAAGLLVTWACPARCRHCYVNAGPGRPGAMAPEAARAHFAALVRLGVAAEGVHVGGGEPFLDFDRLLAVVRAAREAGLDGIGYVETSGFWAVSAEEVRRRVRSLAEAGVRQVSISADPYHQEFVPPERVRLLRDVAGEVLGGRGVRARRWRWLDEAVDVAALPEADRENLFRTFLGRYPERMTGRAAAHLAPLVERAPAEALSDEGCEEALLGSRHVHVDPEGWVYPGTCAGVVLGRATPALPLDEVLGRWTAARGPRAAALAAGGPKRLLAEAARRGFRPDAAGYAGRCHLCWSLRAHLVRAGAAGDDLGPAVLYLTS